MGEVPQKHTDWNPNWTLDHYDSNDIYCATVSNNTLTINKLACINQNIKSFNKSVMDWLTCSSLNYNI